MSRLPPRNRGTAGPTAPALKRPPVPPCYGRSRRNEPSTCRSGLSSGTALPRCSPANVLRQSHSSRARLRSPIHPCAKQPSVPSTFSGEQSTNAPGGFRTLHARSPESLRGDHRTRVGIRPIRARPFVSVHPFAGLPRPASSQRSVSDLPPRPVSLATASPGGQSRPACEGQAIRASLSIQRNPMPGASTAMGFALTRMQRQDSVLHTPCLDWNAARLGSGNRGPGSSARAGGTLANATDRPWLAFSSSHSSSD